MTSKLCRGSLTHSNYSAQHKTWRNRTPRNGPKFKARRSLPDRYLLRDDHGGMEDWESIPQYGGYIPSLWRIVVASPATARGSRLQDGVALAGQLAKRSGDAAETDNNLFQARVLSGAALGVNVKIFGRRNFPNRAWVCQESHDVAWWHRSY